MFKIEDVYVEDKYLPALLKAMAGLVRGAPRPVPVMEVEPNKNFKPNGSGNLVQVFADHLVKQKIAEFSPKDVQDWLAKHGRSKLSANYICKGLRAAGLVRQTGKSSKSRYHVKAAQA